jgi:hypothetical protein
MFKLVGEYNHMDQKNQEKKRWSGKRHVLKVDCNIENEKLQ